MIFLKWKYDTTSMLKTHPMAAPHYKLFSIIDKTFCNLDPDFLSKSIVFHVIFYQDQNVSGSSFYFIHCKHLYLLLL